MRKKISTTIASLSVLVLSACGSGEAPATPTPTQMPTSTATSVPSPTATHTPTPPPGIHVQTSTACYGGPGDTYDVVMTFDAGEQAEIVGRDDADEYWIVKNPDGKGGCWIESQAVTTEGELGYTPYLVPPPTPTPEAPTAPTHVTFNIDCEWRYEWRGYYRRPLSNWAVTITLTWDDQANDEIGYEIFRNGQKVDTLAANTTKYSDFYSSKSNIKGTNLYTIQAFNQVGPSTPVDISVDYICPILRR